MDPAGLFDTARAQLLLGLARAYLPGDWRYPTTGAQPTAEVRSLFEATLPVRPRPQRFEYSCGPASLGILVSAYGVVPEDALLEDLAGVTPDGVETEQVFRAATRLLGERVWTSRRGEYAVNVWARATPSDLDAELAAGNPVLIDFWASFEPNDDPDEDMGHYAVVVAADARDYLIIDPARELNALHARIVPRAELARIWWDTRIDTGARYDGWMMTVRLREKD